MVKKTKEKPKVKKKVIKKKAIKKRIPKKKRKQSKTKALTIVPAPINNKQLLFILQKTPANHISQRKAKGGGTWDYVTGVYVKKALNYAFGWLWNEEVINSGEVSVGGKVIQIWVDIKLTINRINPKTKQIEAMIIKTQTGRADVKYRRNDPKMPLDYGNDRKAAITDGLKKCASELGIASDVYGKNEFNQIQKEDKGFTPPPIETTPNIQEAEVREVIQEPKPEAETPKLTKLKQMLTGKNDLEKVADLNKRTGIKLMKGFNITERHASIVIASLLNTETK